MILHHGTTESQLASILRDGLRPRMELKGKGNWDQHPSRKDCVYLTNSYAFYFANVAAMEAATDREIGSDRRVILEIDVDALKLLPDEDFMAQVHGDKTKPLTARTIHYRNKLTEYRSYWRESLGMLGTVAHRGPIEASRIKRICFVEPHLASRISFMSFDPCINIANQAVMGQYYQDHSAWFFGDKISKPPPKMQRYNFLEFDRNGIEVVTL